MRTLKEELIDLKETKPIAEQVAAITRTVKNSHAANRGRSDMTLYLRGRTFNIKEELKDLGGYWDNQIKAWRFDNANTDLETVLKEYPDCWVRDC